MFDGYTKDSWHGLRICEGYNYLVTACKQDRTFKQPVKTCRATKEIDTKSIKSVMGFVPQDDIVHDELTVREQIQFSARLRNKVFPWRPSRELLGCSFKVYIQLAEGPFLIPSHSLRASQEKSKLIYNNYFDGGNFQLHAYYWCRKYWALGMT